MCVHCTAISMQWSAGSGSRCEKLPTKKKKREEMYCFEMLAGFSLLKVHKIEIFFGFDFEICIIFSLLVMSKY
jgi:hypothetical protein